MMVKIPFTKMVGAGNDFILVDTLRHRLAPLKTRWRAVSRALCDRRLGVGADGLLVLEPSRIGDVAMRVFNPDGSEAEFCGNGARCVAVYVTGSSAEAVGRQAGERPVAIEAGSGLLAAVVRGDRVCLQMPDPVVFRLDLPVDIGRHRFRVGFVNTGVPHAVVPVDAIDEVDVDRIGRALRHHRQFAPRGTNVDFVQVDARRPSRLRVRTYERGVEAETPACGSGVTASAIVHALRGDLRLDPSTRAPDMAGGLAQDVAPGGRPGSSGAPGMPGGLHARRAPGDGQARLPRNAEGGQARQCRIDVEARSGDVLSVSLTVVPEGRLPVAGRRRQTGRWRVTDVVLEGAARRVFDGMVDWSSHLGRPRLSAGPRSHP